MYHASPLRHLVPSHIRAALPMACLVLGLWLLAGPLTARANRFGPPWQSLVTAAQTVVYSQPDRGSPPVGPLGKGAIVVVTGEVKGNDGSDWVSIIDGFVPAGDVAEATDPWVAEVSVPSVSVYAKPDAKSPIRRTAQAGDLLRVTGVSPGVDGDPSIWWSTTEGYVGMRTLAQAGGDWAANWTMPKPDEALQGWWGIVQSPANVRAGATTDAPIVGQLNPGDRVKVLGEEEGENVGGVATWYRIDGGRYAGARVHGALIAHLPDPTPDTTPPEGRTADRWIVVDRSAATLTYVEHGQPVFTTYVSLGLAGVETPTGDYATFGKYRADDMTSASVPDADHSYDLPNVPFTQYYRDGGYALHGTYWHDRFGLRESQGCINVTVTDAAYLFSRTQPEVPADQNALWTGMDQATPVVIVGR